MPLERFFPTLIWTARLGLPALDRELRREAAIFRKLDHEGRAWSRDNYPHGYTSYSSLSNLPERSSTFEELERRIDREVGKFARALDLDLGGGRLRMTRCWLNVMGKGCQHSFHLHPLAVISGTYYLTVPRGSAPLKLEDPRVQCFMGSPPRRARARSENRRYVEVAPRAGMVVLFESWLNHEVPASRVRDERVSVSFNYEWA